MAASSSFSTAFALHTHVHGGGGVASSSSSVPVRFLSGAVFGRVSRRSLILRSRGVSLVSPRCEAASDGAVPLNSIRSSSASALELLKTSAANRYTKERSSIIVIGLSVHSTPVEIREKLAIPEAEWPRAIGELCKLNHIEEAAVLSTCNRLEIYVLALSQHRGVKEVTEWMSKTSGVPISEICKHRFLLHNRDATEHLYEVSSGLDSLVLGEGQILSQVKHVVTVGQSLKEFGRTIGGMFKEAIRVGKRVRTETNISSGAVSVSSAAVELALKKLPQSPHTTTATLVVGAGKMGKLVIKHLAAKGFKKITVVNRSEERVKALRNEMKDAEIIYKPFSELYACAVKSDVIFTCTASGKPLFLKEHVQHNQTVLFVDISVPRNVGSCVAAIETAKVYNVDDLKEVVDANKEDRFKKATEAKTIIDVEVRKFEAWRDSQETVPTIRGLNAVAERIRSAELEKCLSKFGDDLTKKEKRAIEDMSNSIVRSLLSGPLQHLRCDGSGKRSMAETIDNMNALNRMYNLEDEIAAVLKEKIRAKMDRSQK